MRVPVVVEIVVSMLPSDIKRVSLKGITNLICFTLGLACCSLGRFYCLSEKGNLGESKSEKGESSKNGFDLIGSYGDLLCSFEFY